MLLKWQEVLLERCEVLSEQSVMLLLVQQDVLLEGSVAGAAWFIPDEGLPAP